MQKRLILITVSILFLVTASAALAENLVIKGSTTVLPIAQRAIEAYMAEHPDVRISLSGGGSSNGLRALIDGSTDIANASRFIKQKEVEKAVERNIYPVPFAIAYDSIIPVVHAENSLTDIDLEDLRGIYKGEITNFKEIGGPDLQIVVTSRDTSSGTYETWETKVMEGDKVNPRAQVVASNGAVVQAVSNNKHCIGYIGIGYVDSSIKPLKVEGIEGTEKTTLDGSYPISRPLFMFTNGWPQGASLDFINFMLSPEKGQNHVKDSGYVRLY